VAVTIEVHGSQHAFEQKISHDVKISNGGQHMDVWPFLSGFASFRPVFVPLFNPFIFICINKIPGISNYL
jgi:hypothetical protein